MVAKDGTNRGNRAGNYTGAGRKAAPLTDRIAAGQAAQMLEMPEFEPETLLDGDTLEGADLPGDDMPLPSDFLARTVPSAVTMFSAAITSNSAPAR
jgi:hypothetical protein